VAATETVKAKRLGAGDRIMLAGEVVSVKQVVRSPSGDNLEVQVSDAERRSMVLVLSPERKVNLVV